MFVTAMFDLLLGFPTFFFIWMSRDEGTLWLSLQVKLGLYSVIQKDGLSFVSLYFKIRTSDKYNVNYI